MTVVVNLQLTPTAKEQWKTDTLERGSGASNVISQRGYEAGGTRKSLATFSGVGCGYTAAADFVGARNIRACGAALVLAPRALRLV
jgi:hypothetical protein